MLNIKQQFENIAESYKVGKIIELTAPWIALIDHAIDIDFERREDTQKEFEAFFDCPITEKAIEVKGVVYIYEDIERDTNFYQVEFSAEYDEVKFYEQEKEVELSKDQIREILSHIKFEAL